ncbi:hypothetical protein PVAP13_4KG312410 [Panicum virgatum]|uniref:Uncharacterized protein n=1 Tax=Panicum virgatum TaxID=38727 RepID=A0A8T0TUN1_PANVG|nr:hypothetical protein PVAP13_4KG312410 [Panicum virgatum]
MPPRRENDALGRRRHRHQQEAVETFAWRISSLALRPQPANHGNLPRAGGATKPSRATANSHHLVPCRRQSRCRTSQPHEQPPRSAAFRGLVAPHQPQPTAGLLLRRPRAACSPPLPPPAAPIPRQHHRPAATSHDAPPASFAAHRDIPGLARSPQPPPARRDAQIRRPRRPPPAATVASPFHTELPHTRLHRNRPAVPGCRGTPPPAKNRAPRAQPPDPTGAMPDPWPLSSVAVGDNPHLRRRGEMLRRRRGGGGGFGGPPESPTWGDAGAWA